MRVIVAGSRTFDDYDLLCKKMDHYLKNMKDVIIVCGKAPGADDLGERYANERGYPVDPYPADWQDMSEPCVRKAGRYGYYNALAGHKRNEKMAEVSQFLVAFHDGTSTGTADMIRRAENHKLKYKVVLYK